MGRIAGGAVPAHACSRQHRAASERRLGERRLDGGFSDGRRRRRRARSSNGFRATASGAVGPAPTGTWCSSASRIRRQANGLSLRTPRSNARRSSAKSRSSRWTTKGNWSVRVPELRKDSAGVTWHDGSTPGHSIPLSRFYIAHAGVDTAATINAELAQGKDLLFAPGMYDLTEPIRVQRAEHRGHGPRICDSQANQWHRSDDDLGCGRD